MPLPQGSSPAPVTSARVDPSTLPGGPDVLKTRPGESFMYVHYPEDEGNWKVGGVEVDGVETPVWLPLLQKLFLAPGANGVTTRAGNEDENDAVKEALHKVRKRGGVEVPHTEDYLRYTSCKSPITGAAGYIYHDRFETPQARGGRRRGMVKYAQDHQARNLWLLDLIDRGVLKPPPPGLLDFRIANAHQRVVRQEQQLAPGAPSSEKQIAETQARAEIFDDAVVPQAPQIEYKRTLDSLGQAAE